jgi:hypothetical protein
VHHGCCSRAVTRGIDRRVLDGVNAWSLAGFGWESFGLLMFFLEGRRRGRGAPWCVLLRGFSQDERAPNSGEVGMVFLCTCGLCCYMLYVYHMLYACYMSSSEPSSGSSGSVWLCRMAIFGQQNWLCV